MRIALHALLLLLVLAAEPPVKVRLSDVLANPLKYHGLTIEATAETTKTEDGMDLCSLGCDQSRSMDDLVYLHIAKGVLTATEAAKLDAAYRGGRHVRATFVGRFEVSEAPRWGYANAYRFRLILSRVTAIQSSDKPFKR
jgi:hypothetical protein